MSTALSIERTVASLVLDRKLPAGFVVERERARQLVIERTGLSATGGAGGIRIEPKTGFGNGTANFVLDFLPANPASVRMLINGHVYRPPGFIIAGQNITWQAEFTIEADDEIEFHYPTLN